MAKEPRKSSQEMESSGWSPEEKRSGEDRNAEAKTGKNLSRNLCGKPSREGSRGGFLLLALRPGGGRTRPRALLHRDTGLCHLPAEEPWGCLQAGTGAVRHPAPGKGAKIAPGYKGVGTAVSMEGTVTEM